MKRTLIDTHSHMLKASYEEELINRIEQAQREVKLLLNISWDIKTSHEVISLNKKYPFMKPVVGIHPSHAHEDADKLHELDSLITKDVLAIGEIGLDYYHTIEHKDIQKKIFIEQIKIAKKHNLPIIVHTRNSLEDAWDIIKNFPEQKFLLHSWSGNEELTKEYLTHKNIYFSFTGVITFKNAEDTRKAFLTIPKERILSETDCPWLAPVPHRGKENIPQYVSFVNDKMAELWNISIAEADKLLENNFNRFFNEK